MTLMHILAESNFEAKPSELDSYFRLRLVVVEYVYIQLIAVGPSPLYTSRTAFMSYRPASA